MLFDRAYYIDKIREYNKKIKCEKINKFEVSKIDGLKGIIPHYLFEINEEIEEAIIELSDNTKTWMRLTPLEIEGCYESIKRAKGTVGVVGLGLGYFIQEILKKKEVKNITVYETSKDVIEIYKHNFGEDDKIEIIQEDAFKSQSRKFDFFFVDIYEYKLTSKIAEDYKFFNELHDIKEYSFWGVERFLLSCTMEDLMHLCIPEEWMDMARDLYDKFNDSYYFNQFKPLDYKEIEKLLNAFERIL